MGIVARMVGLVAALGGADCEAIRSGWLAQPANAVSSLAYVAVGAWLLARGRSAAVRRGLHLSAGAAMVAVGIGSFAYHGPQPGWAHLAHDASIVAVALVVGASQVVLLTRPRTLLGVWRQAAPWAALALIAYWEGRTASSLCRPDAWWQYHAAWHTLSAVALGVITGRVPPPAGRARA